MGFQSEEIMFENIVLERIFGTKREKATQRDGYITSSFTICSLYSALLRWLHVGRMGRG
jgi:hypothetical protein